MKETSGGKRDNGLSGKRQIYYDSYVTQSHYDIASNPT